MECLVFVSLWEDRHHAACATVSTSMARQKVTTVGNRSSSNYYKKNKKNKNMNNNKNKNNIKNKNKNKNKKNKNEKNEKNKNKKNKST